MPVNPYDDSKVTRPHRNGDLDIVWASYTRDRANVMPRLHLPYEEYTMPLRCRNQHFLAASGRPCYHRTDLRASWPLRFCLTPHNGKFEKIVSP